MLSITSTSHFVKFQAMPMQELYEKITPELENEGFKTSLNNLTDDTLSLKIIDKSTTVLTIDRHRHRPFELEVIVDHTLNKKQGLVSRRKRTRQRDGSLINYRYLWIGIIFFGALLSIFYFFIGIFLDALNTVTPGWSSLQQALGIIVVVLVIGLFWILVMPTITKHKKESMKKYDKNVLEIVCGIIKGLKVEIEDDAVLRCWSCFKEIDHFVKLCSHCGEQQN